MRLPWGSYGDFYAVKVGDVNQSCNCGQKPGKEEDAKNYLRILPNSVQMNGDQISIPVWSDAPFEMIAAQAGIRFDPAIMRLKTIVPNRICGVEDINFGTTNSESGEIRFAWFSMDGYTLLPKNALLFTLVFEKLSSSVSLGPLCWTSREILDNLVFDEGGIEIPVKLIWEGKSKGNIMSLSVLPNPFQDEFSIHAFTEAPVEAVVSLSNGQGRIYSRQVIQLQAGENSLQLDASLNMPPGVYIVSFETSGQLLQRRMTKL